MEQLFRRDQGNSKSGGQTPVFKKSLPVNMNFHSQIFANFLMPAPKQCKHKTRILPAFGMPEAPEFGPDLCKLNELSPVYQHIPLIIFHSF